MFDSCPHSNAVGRLLLLSHGRSSCHIVPGLCCGAFQLHFLVIKFLLLLYISLVACIPGQCVAMLQLPSVAVPFLENSTLAYVRCRHACHLQVPRSAPPKLEDLGLLGHAIGPIVISFYLLNMFWMRKMVMGAIKILRPKKS